MIPRRFLLAVLPGLAALLLPGLSKLAAAEKPAPKAYSLSPLLVDEAGNKIVSPAVWMKRRAAIRADWQTFLGEFPKQKVPLKAEVSWPLRRSPSSRASM